MRTTKQGLALLAFGLTGASALGQVGAPGGVAVRAPGVVVPAPTSFVTFPDVPEPRSNPVRHPRPRNVTDAHPYGDDPSGAAPSVARLEPAIDASNPYAFTGSRAAFPERALPHAVAFRQLDPENPYGPLAAVEHAPIDSENPYVTSTR